MILRGTNRADRLSTRGNQCGLVVTRPPRGLSQHLRYPRNRCQITLVIRQERHCQGPVLPQTGRNLVFHVSVLYDSMQLN